MSIFVTQNVYIFEVDGICKGIHMHFVSFLLMNNLNMILSFCAKHFKIELKVLYCFIV